MTKKGRLCDEYPNLFNQMKFPDSTITSGSGVSVEWSCDCGYEWFASPASRTKGGKARGCPACRNKVLAIGINDLATVAPSVAAEVVDDSNTHILARSTKKIEWRCHAGHRWVAQVYRRVDGTGCPYCSGNTVEAGVNDISVTHPDVYSMLDGDEPVTHGSSKILSWKCQNGHMWKQQVCQVVAIGRCPYCAGIRPGGTKTLPDTLVREWSALNEFSPFDVLPSSAYVAYWECVNGHEWQAPVYSRTRGHGCPRCILHGTSRSEIEFADAIHRAGVEIERNTRSVIPPLELDIYVPKLKKAIEFNGDYWHRDGKRDMVKAQRCIDANVSLMTVLESEYLEDKTETINRVLRWVYDEEN